MMRPIRNISSVLWLLALLSCSALQNAGQELVKLSDGDFQLHINPDNLQLQFALSSGEVLVPQDSISGLYLNDEPVIEILSKVDSSAQQLFEVATNNTKATVRISFEDGGKKRWLSTFTIFPKNRFAGVYFDRGKRSIVLGTKAYHLNTVRKGSASFYFFLGTNKEIYANYRKVRNEWGYEDISPKSRLFELGWNTNQETVKEMLSKFLAEGYPIRWAVTGSGFWDEGGTTTSFGRWGSKFPNPVALRAWMHKNNMSWMI